VRPVVSRIGRKSTTKYSNLLIPARLLVRRQNAHFTSIFHSEVVGSFHPSFISGLSYPRFYYPLISMWSLEWRRIRYVLIGNRSKVRAIGQAVSHWLPTEADRVQTRDQSCEICGGQSGTGAGFLRVLRFPLPIFIPSASPQSYSLSPEAGTIGQEWPQYQETQSHPTKNNKKLIELPSFNNFRETNALGD
jgi:hypothetical protein